MKKRVRICFGLFHHYDPSAHSNIIAALDFVMNETDCDRAYVMEFHNGEHYFSGRGQQKKLSCTYEVISEGIELWCHSLQNIRISNFHAMVKDIAENKTFVCSDTENYNEDIGFKSFLEQKGVQNVC